MAADRRVPAHGALLLTLRSSALRLAAATLAAAGTATPGWAIAPGLAENPGWSAPAALSSCAADGGPRVLFPAEGPSQATGPGAIVWSAAPGCPIGTGARVDVIGPGGAPAPPRAPRAATGAVLSPLAPLQAAAGPRGEIAIAGRDASRPGQGILIQGPASGPFAALPEGPRIAATGALSTAYLGDLGILAATGPPGRGLEVELERHFAARPERLALIPGPAVPEAIALDYRSDALAVWLEHGALYACELPAQGRPQRPERLGTAGGHPHVVALLSDDDRAIVMWSSASGASTKVFLDQSAPGVRFGAPQLLESTPDADGIPAPAASPQLVRLSSESVLAAWAGVAGGHWVLRTAPIDQRGLRTVSTIAPASGDALLDALAPGPRGEAVMLWSEPAATPGGVPDQARESLLAARGTEGAPGVAVFGPSELVAAPGPVADATVSIDPASDLALAAWLGEGGSIRFAARPSMPAP